MKNTKTYLLLAILTLAIGFATLTTTLIVNGTISISSDEEGFINGIIFDESSISVSIGTEYSLSESGRTITFTTPIMKSIGDTAEVNFKIKNDSIYNAKLGNPALNCYFVNDFTEDTKAELISETNNYISVASLGNLNGKIINSKSKTDLSKITVQMKKSYAGETPLTIKYQCEINIESTEESGVEPQICTLENPTATIEENYTWYDSDCSGTKNEGDEIAVGEEHFYVISNDGESLKALAKYNLLVGNEVDVESWDTTPLTNPTGIQSPLARGYVDGADKFIGTVVFSNNNGWPYENNDDINIKEYAGPVKTALYDETTGYESYIQKTIPNAIVRLITKSELEELGCSSETYSCISSFEYTCDDWDVENDYNGCSTHQEGETITVQTGATAPEWVYSTSFWSGSADSDGDDGVWVVYSFGGFYGCDFDNGRGFGVRPVIEIPLQ